MAVVTGLPDPRSHVDVQRYPPDVIFKKPLDFTKLMEWLNSLT